MCHMSDFNKCYFAKDSKVKSISAKEAKELSLKIWEYFADHPELKRKDELPSWLFSQIEFMVLNCPLCEFFFQNIISMSCYYCPLDSCNTEGSLYMNWSRSIGYEERKYHAQRIINALKAWDTNKTIEQLCEL